MKLAAFDLDGTIYFDGYMPEEVPEAIAQWRAAGNLAVVATGKSPHSARRALEPFGVEFDYFLLCNGTVIMDGDYELLYESHVPPEVVRAVYERVRDIPKLDLYCTRLEGLDGHLVRNVAGVHNPIISEPVPVSPERIEKEVFPLVAAWTPGDPELQKEIAQWVTDRFPVGTAMNRNFFDITPPGHDKGFALTWLLEHLSRERSEIELITLGDGHNDLPMHALADVSLAFPWAQPDLQEACTAVVDSAVKGLIHYGA
ncbi:haloacid dehalogenase [Corynebacterium sp. HMSC076G08]|uniref:HAD family hydrolase n=1 Tax=Corynebacterium sp. HMSC076G08 TaxID=1739310 RepID=UPI0008A5AE7F|nr:HAD family hydrolase [Corynebacterium sp. HMSC076G08]OFK64494.1 haloacid dehalogenase [Corynebacterium sp. HMSC076G08]